MASNLVSVTCVIKVVWFIFISLANELDTSLSQKVEFKYMITPVLGVVLSNIDTAIE